MADDSNETPSNGQPAEAAQQANADGERKFTQADLDRIVADRLSRARKSNGQFAQPQPSGQAAAATTTSSKADIPDTAMLIAEFSDHIDILSKRLKVDVPVELKQKLRPLYVNERPTDPNAWIEGWLTVVGAKRPEPPTTTATNQQSKPAEQQPPEQKRNGPPISDKGPAANTVRDVDAILLDRPNELSKPDIERLQAKHGTDKANLMIADAMRRYLDTVKLRPDRRR